MRVLGIMGSPRIDGNTDLLLEEAFRGARTAGAETERIVADKLKVAPCREYYDCLKKGDCIIRDDMDALYPKLWTAERIILASPIFFYGVSAQVKAIIDRSQALWARKYVLKQRSPTPGRKGAFIAVGATRGDKLFEGSILTVRYFFKAIDVEYAGELLVRGADHKGDIKEQPAALKEAFELGKKLVLG